MYSSWKKGNNNIKHPEKEEAPVIVSCEWLKQQLYSGNQQILVLDVTWFPGNDKGGHQEYLKKHIPTAIYLDIFDAAEHTKILPRNIPEGPKYETLLQSVGVTESNHVILYDCEGKNGFFAAGRAAWQFKLYGKEKVSILNGGLQKWEALGFHVTADVSDTRKGNFLVKYKGKWRKSFEDLQSMLGQGNLQLVDARPPDQYQETHIPGAINLPFGLLFKDGTMKSHEELQKVFSDKGVDLSQPLVVSCRSGMTSCTVALAAHLAGAEHVSVYNGGIIEWKARANPDQMETS